MCQKKAIVTEMSSDDFYSLKRLSEDIGFTNSKAFKITEVKVFKLTQDDPTKLLFKTSYIDDEFSETIITRKKTLLRLPSNLLIDPNQNLKKIK